MYAAHGSNNVFNVALRGKCLPIPDLHHLNHCLLRSCIPYEFSYLYQKATFL